MPGRVTSKVYFARPLTLSGPSRRLTRVPTTVFGVDGQLYFGSTGGCCGAPPRPAPPCGGCPWLTEGLRPSDSPTRSLARRSAGALRSRGSLATARSLGLATRHLLAQIRTGVQRVGQFALRRALSTAGAQACHRFEHTRERAAAADVAVETLLDLLGSRVRIFLEEADARHDEARRAEAAHQRVLVAERLLHRMELAGAGQAVDGANLLALTLNRERRTGVDRSSVHDHRAGAARAAVAAALVARHVGAHAQRVEQRDARLDLQAQ